MINKNNQYLVITMSYMSFICDKHRCDVTTHYAVIFPCGGDNLLRLGHIKKTAWGTNSNIYHKGRMSIHAEEVAIKKALANRNFKWDKNYNIFVFRTSKQGQLGASRPCANCIILMNRCKLTINYVYYSTSNGTIVRERLNEMYDSQLTRLSSGDLIKVSRSTIQTS